MFQDLFDKQAEDYARYRPGYPDQLFDLIAGYAPARELAWDAGTGSGQAALSLAKRFDSVLATDSSAAQIQNAHRHAAVRYEVSPAEHAPLSDESCDAVTVANAVHWFDIPAFFAEVERVLKPGGVVAVWCYTDVLPDERIAPAVRELKAAIKPYWPAPVSLVADKYRDLYFPFAELPAPELTMRQLWTFEQCLGYFSTWSAVEKYRTAEKQDPIAAMRQRFPQLAADGSTRYEVLFPLPMRVGRKPPGAKQPGTKRD